MGAYPDPWVHTPDPWEGYGFCEGQKSQPIPLPIGTLPKTHMGLETHDNP
jgi:hypothetical protein